MGIQIKRIFCKLFGHQRLEFSHTWISNCWCEHKAECSFCGWYKKELKYYEVLGLIGKTIFWTDN